MTEYEGRHAGELIVDHMLHKGDYSSAEELIQQLQMGCPVDCLRVLLTSSDSSAVKAGAYVASEIRDRVVPLAEDLVSLLDHPSGYVKYYVVEAFEGCAKVADLECTTLGVCKCISLLRDSDAPVRVKAMWFLSQISQSHIIEAEKKISDREVCERMTWLLEMEISPQPQEIFRRLDGACVLDKRFASVVAARKYLWNPTLLKHATQSADEDVREFAKMSLEDT